MTQTYTKLLYLEDPYIRETQSKIMRVEHEKENIWKLILDETIFYPMGGGQPTDQGKILFPNGIYGDVYQILFQDGQVYHYVKMAPEPIVGEEVNCLLDWERRYKNMRVHSAGHVIDFAVYLLGHSPKPLFPIKGDHGKKPHITYEGMIEKDIKEELQNKTNELIQNNLGFSWCFDRLENVQKEAIYLQPGLPQNKPLRALKLDGVGTVADGGTIVKWTSEVGHAEIIAVTVSNGRTVVSYQI